jgi:hypothetical protein
VPPGRRNGVAMGFWAGVWQHLVNAAWIMAWPAPPDDGTIGTQGGPRDGLLPRCCAVSTGVTLVVVCLETECVEVAARRPDLLALGLVRPRTPI